MARAKKCVPGTHDYKPMRGGKHEKCQKCNDVFPCYLPCHHWDCNAQKGKELPAIADALGVGIKFP